MPGRSPRTKTCQMWKVLFVSRLSEIASTGCGSSWLSKSNNSTLVAHSLNTAKLTPSRWTVAPSGWLRPGSVANGGSELWLRAPLMNVVATVEKESKVVDINSGAPDLLVGCVNGGTVRLSK